jgi:hypothetical protein
LALPLPKSPLLKILAPKEPLQSPWASAVAVLKPIQNTKASPSLKKWNFMLFFAVYLPLTR